MARLPRLIVPEYPMHLVVRGNDRQDIFRSEGDRVFFHRCLTEISRRHEVAIHAYVLMSNHVHLLATGAAPNSLAKVNLALGSTESKRQYAYGRIFENGVGDEEGIRDALRRGSPLGDRQFCKEIEEISGRRVLPRPRGRPRKSSN